MPIINNSNLTREIIDGAKINLITDEVPGLLARSVVPVMEVNPKLVKPVNVHEIAASAGTIYTVPSTGKFYLTSAAVTAVSQNQSALRNAAINVTLKGGSSKVIVYASVASGGATETTNSQSLNYVPPILLEPGSTITLGGTPSAMVGIITGVYYPDA